MPPADPAPPVVPSLAERLDAIRDRAESSYRANLGDNQALATVHALAQAVRELAERVAALERAENQSVQE